MRRRRLKRERTERQSVRSLSPPDACARLRVACSLTSEPWCEKVNVGMQETRSRIYISFLRLLVSFDLTR